jgi:hypothetical protein
MKGQEQCGIKDAGWMVSREVTQIEYKKSRRLAPALI